MPNKSHHSALNKVTFAGLLITIGIVFGDIGTSPLYVVKAIISGVEHFDKILIYGGISCVFWTLTLQTTIKYALITLRADNHGEGGIFALFALMKKKSTWAAVLTMVGGSALLADGDGKKLTYQATVPANTTATLYLPATSEKSVTEGGKPANAQQGIKFIEFRNGKAVFELQSGTYQFAAE
jgi:hypothetical protein